MIYIVLLCVILFTVGALVYPGIEVWWDNTSHRSMGLVGGSAFLLCGWYDEWFAIDYVWLMLIIAVTVTTFEYVAGRIWNKDHGIWDYSGHPFNLHGQISLTFFAVWFLGMSHVIIYLDNAIRLAFWLVVERLM